MEEILYREEMMWLQRSRISWLQEGDRNTTFFHHKAASRGKKNKVDHLRNDQGVMITNMKVMGEMTINIFQNLFSAYQNICPDELLQLIQPRILEEMNDSLCREFTDEEIADALFQIGPLKAPGLDGFPAQFFQRNWSIVKEDITRGVQEFFRTGRTLAGANDTEIVMIPKVDKPELLKDFRPISLCNVLYKIVSKCLVNRLRPLLDEIIDTAQSALIPGQMIMDNALIAFECLHALKNGNRNCRRFGAYKLDLTKAYDRVDWRCLERILQQLGFHNKWVQWVIECVSTVRYTVRLNNVQLDSFQSTRGLQQGDPLSPSLSICG
jgi:hypothetical protein